MIEKRDRVLYIPINKNRNTGYCLTVLSLFSCFSYGDTLKQAIEKTKKKSYFTFKGILEDSTEPEIYQSALATRIAVPEYAEAQWSDVEVKIDQLILKSD